MAELATPDPEAPQRWVLVLADHGGFAMRPADAVLHVEEHIDNGDDEQEWDEPCSQCPRSVSLRTGSALPSEPDAHGLNSRIPTSHHVRDVLMEDDDLEYDTLPDLLAKLRGAQVLAATLAGDFVTEHLRARDWTPDPDRTYPCGCSAAALCAQHAETRAVEHYNPSC